MCGISGFCDFSLNYYDKKPFWETILVQMHETLKHRGPDQAMIDLQPHVGLSHARLSIRDLKSGIQPMTRTFHGKTCSIVYNGEIYNHRELLPELQAAGYRFTTTSDTEIILCAYMHFGKNFVEKLNGIFAFAIWDDTNRELLLYRDRAGTKPLFYTQTGSSFVFGSEPKALFCHPDVTPSIDQNSLQEILAVGPARTSGNGVFTGVKEVMPGHYHIFCPDGQHDILYWDLPCREHKDSYAKTVQTVSFLVRDTVERQMVSDVPVCTFLSGGIDSSIVTALAALHMQKEGKILNTFSFDFSENEKYFKSNAFQPERDLPYVNRMLQYCKTSHTYLECSQEALFAALSDAVTAKDLPGMTDVDASLLYFCSEVAKHNKVTLTGECADEIFGGYPWFYRPELMNRDGFPWSADPAARTSILSDDVLRTLDLAEYSHARYEETLSHVPHLDGESPEEARRRDIGYLNIKWFMQTLLDRMDPHQHVFFPGSPCPICRSPDHGICFQCAVADEISEWSRKIPVAGCLCRSAATGTALAQKKPVSKDIPSGLRTDADQAHAGNSERSEFSGTAASGPFQNRSFPCRTKGTRQTMVRPVDGRSAAHCLLYPDQHLDADLSFVHLTSRHRISIILH